MAKLFFKIVIITSLFLYWGWICNAQVFLNGSFERTTATSVCHYNLTNANFNGFMKDVKAYGLGNEMDIMVAGCAVPSIPNGIFCVALAHDPTDEIAIALSAPLTIGNAYSFTFFAYSDVTIRPQGDLEIGLSTTNNSFGSLVYTAITIPSTWIKYRVSFVATTQANYVTVRNKTGAVYWNRVDQFTFDSCSINLNLGKDTSLCSGATLPLNVSNPSATYLWQDNSTDSTFTITHQGIYWVEVSQNNCRKRDSIIVSSQSLPLLNLGNDTILCQGEVLPLNVSASNANYMWQDNSTNPFYTITQQGTYWVRATNQCGSVTDTIHVSYDPLMMVNFGNDTSLCEGETLLLNATTSKASYLWQDGTTKPSLIVSKRGTYWVKLSRNNCSTYDTINVSYTPLPTIDLGKDTSLCDGDILLLDGTTLNASYLWQDGSSNPTFSVSKQGNYWLKLMVNNCSSTDNINVKFISLPTVDLGNDTSLCPSETITLDATTANASYLWQDYSANSTLIANQQGIYWVKVTVDNCSGFDTINIGSIDLPIINLGSDTTICRGRPLVLDAENPNASYLWQNGSTNPKFIVAQEGTYWVEAKNKCGITTDSITIKVDECFCFLFLPDAFSPNTDSINDGFSPISNCKFVEYNFMVFDRWGEKLFETSNSANFWDGTLKGVTLPSGVYVYLISYTFENDVKKTKHGTVTLIR